MIGNVVVLLTEIGNPGGEKTFGPNIEMILSTAGNKILNQRQPKTPIFLIEVWADSFRFGSAQRCPAPDCFSEHLWPSSLVAR